MAWHENDGSEQFTQLTIEDSFDDPRSIYAVDLDSDGDVDVLGAAREADAVAWWEQGSALVSPPTLSFGVTFTELSLNLLPENPTDTWTLNETIPWLSLSDVSGTGAYTVTVSVDRGGLSEGTYEHHQRRRGR